MLSDFKDGFWFFNQGVIQSQADTVVETLGHLELLVLKSCYPCLLVSLHVLEWTSPVMRSMSRLSRPCLGLAGFGLFLASLRSRRE